MLLAVMQQELLRYNLGHMLVTAWTGIASAPFGTQTLCSLLKLDFKKLDADKPMTGDQISIMQANFSKIYCEPKDLLVLVIDEISFVVSSVLHHLDIQLQRLRGVYDVPFGGVILILAGDFHQKAPPQSGNVSLAELLVQETLPELLSHEPLKPHKPSAKGLMHFRRAVRTTLSEQMRAAEDPCLQAHLERLRDTNLQQPVTTELLAALKPLSPQDIVDNPHGSLHLWLFWATLSGIILMSLRCELGRGPTTCH